MVTYQTKARWLEEKGLKRAGDTTIFVLFTSIHTKANAGDRRQAHANSTALQSSRLVNSALRMM